jgi:hypothetical protein
MVPRTKQTTSVTDVAVTWNVVGAPAAVLKLLKTKDPPAAFGMVRVWAFAS